MNRARALRDRLGAWREAHADAARRSLARRLQAPVMSLISIAVLGFILALPAFLWVLLDNARALSAHVDHEPRIAVYLEAGESDALQEHARELERLADVGRVTAVPAERALEDYRADLADPALLDWMDGNPLPDTLDVVPERSDPETVTRLETALAERFPDATLVSDDEWVRQLNALYQLGTRVLTIVAGLLGLGALLVLALASASELRERREEITIARISGATHRFLRRPSLYGGVYGGLGGGLFAVLLLYLGTWLAREPLETAAGAFDIDYALRLPGPEVALGVVMAAVILGWAGARLGSGHALRDAP
ncbi:cell division transport system permease protein [Thioalkalivibrio sp. ALE21]|uniref:cell division protein FtsX n=1 Tax=Thioalkalivibrio sp. ALE21 TaxID=1158175 RepID=UPI000D9C36B3|nr:permease-like cell division protein FtsX [Thioalkalivibrio sp. ALE21]PYG01511.1 cell division transport system permease protein [Thioalkalivibrio sp. ALE21]